MTEPAPMTSSPWIAGLRGRCPRCGEGHLFDGVLKLAPSCDRCGLDYSFADSGDGPAVFIILIVGFVLLGAVLAVDATYEPAWWVHALIWPPLTLVLCVGLLRPAKGLMIASQYHNQSGEGRFGP
jgi:uncharacterized protein (DUF983 family)